MSCVYCIIHTPWPCAVIHKLNGWLWSDWGAALAGAILLGLLGDCEASNQFSSAPKSCNTTTSSAAVSWSLPAVSVQQPLGDALFSSNDKQWGVIYTDTGFGQICLSIFCCDYESFCEKLQWHSTMCLFTVFSIMIIIITWENIDICSLNIMLTLVSLSSFGLCLSEVRVTGLEKGWEISLPHRGLRENKPMLLKYLSVPTVCAATRDAMLVSWCWYKEESME